MEFTKENALDQFELINGIKVYKAGTYPGRITFHGECSFPSWTTFGEFTDFTGKSSFGEKCRFGNSCTFSPKATFDRVCSFENGCLFRSETSFGERCFFNGSFGFGPRQSFSKPSYFNGNSTFGKNCRFEGKVAKDDEPIFTASPVGFHGLIFTAYNLKEGIFVRYSALEMQPIEEFRLNFLKEEKFFNCHEDYQKTYMEVMALADFVEMKWSK